MFSVRERDTRRKLSLTEMMGYYSTRIEGRSIEMSFLRILILSAVGLGLVELTIHRLTYAAAPLALTSPTSSAIHCHSLLYSLYQHILHSARYSP